MSNEAIVADVRGGGRLVLPSSCGDPGAPGSAPSQRRRRKPSDDADEPCDWQCGYRQEL